MVLNVGSYNIWLGKAFDQAGELADSESLDVLCLQECDQAKVSKRLGKLQLAGSAKLGQVALAMYFNPSKLELVEFSSHKLPAAWYERSRNDSSRLQLARFKVSGSESKVAVGNMHLAHLAAPNIDRRKQIQAALELTNEFRAGSPAVLAGDTNYTFFERGLNKVVTGAGFREIGRDTVGRTHMVKLMRNKLDRIFASGDVEEIDHKIMPISISDHAAVITKVDI